MAHDVFISYSKRDKAMADAACARIESRKVRCWIAPRDVQAGTDYGESLTRAIQGCKIVVLILSTSSNASRFVKREIEIAVNHGSVIIPFRIEELELSMSLNFFLSTIHWLDALTEPREAQLEKLADTVSLVLKGSEGTPIAILAPTEPAVTQRRGSRWRRWVLALAGAVGLIAALAAIDHNSRVKHPGAGVSRTDGQVPETPVSKANDPCDPNVLPDAEPTLPADLPQADAEHPLLPSDSKKSKCLVDIRNETGKRVRIWRHVYRPKESDEAPGWRYWLACDGSPPPPLPIAGWTYFVVEDLDDHSDKSRVAYFEVGWRFVSYYRKATIRLNRDFFRWPDGPGSFTIDYIE